MKGEFLSLRVAQKLADIEKENNDIWEVYLRCATERYELLEQKQELEKRIDKARDYIYSTKYELKPGCEDFDVNIYDLLDILEGKK